MVAIIVQDGTSKQIIQADYAVENYTYSNEARLNMITLDGEPLEGFDPDVLDYEVMLPQGTIYEPILMAEPMHDSAMVIVQPAFQVPGTAIVEVFAEDRLAKKTYSVEYVLATGTGETPKPTVQVYPNPANDHLYISGVKNARVEIYTTDGKLMFSQQGYSGSGINISNLTKGIYILNIQVDGANIVRKKIVVL
jgi:hypothetical protein